MIDDLLNIEEANILIIDDESINIEIIEEILKLHGFQYLTSTTEPEQAISLYQQNPPDLVLLDLKMPHLSGFEVMQKFQQTELNILPPILVLTGMHDRETRLKALANGARDFITKPFDGEEVYRRVRNLLEMFLAHKEIYSHTESLEQTLAERTRTLLDTQREIIEKLGAAAEYRDTETAAHTIRVGHYAYTLAKALGLSEKEAEQLKLAAPLHDIGKIGIPDKILLKPGKLDADEWVMMQQHARIGFDMLHSANCNLLKTAGVIALSHHEKWDGTGYPEGLKETDIHLFGRITAVADVFDALLMERPYKKAWPLDKVLALFDEESGKQFDPELVSIFTTKLSNFLEIRNKYTD